MALRVVYGSKMDINKAFLQSLQGRVAISQNFPDLEKVDPEFVKKWGICCRIFGPKDILRQWLGNSELNLSYDWEWLGHCLLWIGKAERLVALLRSKIPGIEILRLDNEQ